MVETILSNAWLNRCARRISEIDLEITEGDANRIAGDLQKFERTGAMEPEAAADFVARELATPGRAPFERRSTDRD